MKQYRKDNIDKLNEMHKQYYQANKQTIIERGKQYYENNKDRIIQRRTEKITCNLCGCHVNREYISTHQTSKTCKSYVKPVENDE